VTMRGRKKYFFMCFCLVCGQVVFISYLPD